MDNARTIWTTVTTASPTAVTFEHVSAFEDELKRLKEAHLNIVKDQENRICELEGAVTELLDFMKEQQKMKFEEIYQTQMQQAQYPPQTISHYKYCQSLDDKSRDHAYYEPNQGFGGGGFGGGLSGEVKKVLGFK